MPLVGTRRSSPPPRPARRQEDVVLRRTSAAAPMRALPRAKGSQAPLRARRRARLLHAGAGRGRERAQRGAAGSSGAREDDTEGEE